MEEDLIRINKKRTFDEAFDEQEIEQPNKKIKHDDPSILDILPYDVMYYCVSNFLEIEDVIKLFKLNKELYEMADYNSFWVLRYMNDYGVNQHVRFQPGEWSMIYKVVYNDLKQLQTFHDKVCYAIKNNHLNLAWNIIINPGFNPNESITRELLKLIVQNTDTMFLEKYVLHLKKLHGEHLQQYLDAGLYYTIDVNKVEMCELFIKYKAKVDNNNVIPKPLYLAVEQGRYDICKLLIEAGAEVDGMDNRLIPLYRASHDGAVNIVELLCKHRADVNFVSSQGMTPLFVAIQKQHVGVAEILLNYYARHDIYYNTYSPLYIASKNGYLNIVRRLVKKGADVNHVPDNMFTALHVAVEQNHPLVVEYLLDHGANLEMRNKDGLTPLFYACINKRYDIIDFLCERGSIINVMDKHGNELYTDDEVDDECRKILDKYIKKDN